MSKWNVVYLNNGVIPFFFKYESFWKMEELRKNKTKQNKTKQNKKKHSQWGIPDLGRKIMVCINLHTDISSYVDKQARIYGGQVYSKVYR